MGTAGAMKKDSSPDIPSQSLLTNRFRHSWYTPGPHQRIRGPGQTNAMLAFGRRAPRCGSDLHPDGSTLGFNVPSLHDYLF